MYPSAYHSTVYNSLEMEATQMLSTDERIKELSQTYTIEYYSATKRNIFDSVVIRWMNLQPIIQSEISQKEKNKYILTHIYEIQKGGTDETIFRAVVEILYRLWNSPVQNTGVGSLSLLQGIFPTQGLNPGPLHCRWILYQLSHKGSPVETQTERTALWTQWGKERERLVLKHIHYHM